MRDSVRAAFVPFTAPIEGVVPFMYLDVKGLVTTAIGNLIDPIQYALPLPWMVDGRPATRDEIANEWLAVKKMTAMKMMGGGVFRNVTKLRLDPEGLDLVVSKKLGQMGAHLAARWQSFAGWPADAQLGLLSMAWALGPAFRFPMFEAHLRAGNFEGCAKECTISEVGNPGVKPRNVANRSLFANAARVVKDGLDPDVLYYPNTAVAPVLRPASGGVLGDAAVDEVEKP